MDEGEEVTETEVISQSSSDSELSADSAESDGLVTLAESLELPVETLQGINALEHGNLLLKKVVQCLNEKDSVLEQYQNTVNDLTENMSSQESKCGCGVHYIEFSPVACQR